MVKVEGLIPGLEPAEVEGMVVRPGELPKRIYNALGRSRWFTYIGGEKVIPAGALAEATADELKANTRNFGDRSAAVVQEVIRKKAGLE